MAVPHTVLELIERYNRNRTAYRSQQYNEAQLRIEFLNPFFEALGWDVNNKQGYAEAYKDVVNEDAIKIGGATKAPDYSFRIGGTRKFFVEAKKPAVNLKEAGEPAFQLRRYAWSAKLPLSILTDFEELAIYDCRVKPEKDDKAGAARIQYLTYTDYPQRWEEIASVFSREAILKGSFDTYAETTKGKRGTTEVDAAFLQEIELWREMLARHLASRNKHLTQRELNFAVQMTIDRIIFLRICEDRGIEDYERLRSIIKGSGVYGRLCRLFQEADERYNSGLFHFQQEKDVPEPPDTLTPNLIIDDKPLRDIITRLYYPDSPYEFSALPADVLGKVYEQFLGKVIRLSLAHQVQIEDKIEVRRAGGVFYTPTFIVDYIVRHTLSKLLEGKKPGAKGSASKIKIVDPACGSGTFLIGAYQYLLDWHRDRYVEGGPEKHRKELYQGPGGLWLLTTQEKKRILLNSIYGVDIDPQAVEVTKLSLLLKVLEGESNQSLNAQLRLFQERALPDLDRNIKCGNSLIDSNFYNTPTLPLFDDETQYRINAFDWSRAFPDAFSGDDPGFDAVIGNPPYIRIQTMQEWMPETAEYFKQVYQSAKAGNYDIYVVFVERGLSLLNSNGRLGFIMPQKFWHVQYGEALRNLLSTRQNVEEIVGFKNNQVFAAAFVNTCIVILSKRPQPSFQYTEVRKVRDATPLTQALQRAPSSVLSSNVLSSADWVLQSSEVMSVLLKLRRQGVPLEDCTTRIFQGLKTSADKIYVLEVKEETPTSYIAYSSQLGREVDLERTLCHRLIKGTEMRPYVPLNDKRIILFPYVHGGQSMRLIDEARLKKDYPKIYAYLKANEKYLRSREENKMNHAGWYAYGRSQGLDVIALPKLITPDLAPRSSFLVDEIGDLFILGGAAGGYGILPRESINRLYLAGILNSKLLSFFITSSGQQMESGYYSFEARFIRSAPIRTIDLSISSDKTCHDRVVELVEKLLSLYKRLLQARIQQDRSMLQQQIDIAEQQVNRLVYELYGLTEEETNIVEASFKNDQ